MTPDYEAAATRAMETLIRYNIKTAPVDPLPIFKQTPGVLVLSFAEMSGMAEMERQNLVEMFGPNQDAATIHFPEGNPQYVVAYNQRLPFYILQRAMARELGHIVLGHDGHTRTAENRMAEAYCFAHHLLCPRPLVQALRSSGIRLSVEVFGNMTGCYERCLAGIRKEPGVHIDPDLNRKVRDQFSDYMQNLIAFQPYLSKDDNSALADFGHFMDNYEE